MYISQPTARLPVGATIKPLELDAVSGETVQIPDRQRLVHLQFRRFAGCPICNLHLRSFVARYDAILAAGIREVVVFHSTRDELLIHTANLPFAIIADPNKRLYAEFGVETGLRAILTPRGWTTIARSILISSAAILRGKDHMPARRQPNGRLGLPADFLIAPDGQLVARKYGGHASDQWSVDELLERATAYREGRQSPPENGHGSAPQRFAVK